MNKKLKVDVINEKMERLGLNQSDLAKKLSVTRQLVSQWLKNEVFPRPDKLLRLGTALGLSFSDIVFSPLSESLPVISFRQKRNRKESEEETQSAIKKGRLLKNLHALLPRDNLLAPSALINPTPEYDYVQSAADNVRERMNLQPDDILSGEHLVAFFHRLHIVLIPVMWGKKQHYANGLNIVIPGTQMTFVYLNIDSNVLDLNFWMAHELGHVLASTLDASSKEVFAEAFAEALLFPRADAEKARKKLRSATTEQALISTILKIAEGRRISPTTVTKAIARYEENGGLEHTDIPAAIHGATTNLEKRLGAISQELFKTHEPTPMDYIETTGSKFKTPFFAAMREYCNMHLDDAVSFIHQVLDYPLPDSLALLEAFRKASI